MNITAAISPNLEFAKTATTFVAKITMSFPLFYDALQGAVTLVTQRTFHR